jgi:hypothetical protein
MSRIIAIILATALLYGCATPPPSIPDGYNGPIATIKDSENKIDIGKADLFYLSHIDGKQLRNSLNASISSSYGMGNHLYAVLLEHSVSAENHVLTIVGRTAYAMPGRELISTTYEVKGDVELTPKQDETYTIKGILSEEKSSVWIENISNGEIVGKIEVKGPSTLGFFEK